MEGIVMKILLFFLLFLTESFAQDFRGRAYRENELFYIEEHFIISEFEKRIDYKDPDGKLIAQMWMESKKSSNFPSFFFWDKRAGLYYGSYLDKENAKIFTELPSLEIRQLKLENNKVYLTRAGLFFYLSSETTYKSKVHYISHPSLKAHMLKIKKKIKDGKYFEITMHPEKLFDKLFLPRIFVKIEINSGKVIEFKGPSEIADDKGMYPRVEVYYDYPEL
jgi:hypothetical protein